MRRKTFSVIVLAAVLSLTGCASAGGAKVTEGNEETGIEITTEETKPEENNSGIPNPWIDCAGLNEAKESSAVSFMLPDELRSDTNIYRAIPGEMIEIRIADGDICIRAAAKTDEDITGDYNSYDDVHIERIRGIEVQIRCSDPSKVSTALWSDSDMTYSVTYGTEVSHDDAADLIAAVILENSEAY